MSENLIGATTAVFPIRLSVAVASPVDVEWATRDGSAVAGSDYKSTAGTVTFLPGETEKQIEVQVYGQAITPSDDKVFFIRLNPPSNAVLVDAVLTCTINIIDDQGIPSVAVVVAEGRRGPKGDPGLSAYEQAVLMGYTGTLTEWMDQIADASKAADRAGDHAVSASEDALKAQEDALKAQNAAKNAVFAGVVFPTAAEGVDPVLGVQNGAYFNVRSPLSEHYIDEYQNVNGVAVATGKSYPTSGYVQDISEYIALPFVLETVYKLNQRVVLTNGDIVKSTIDGNANDPNMDMTWWDYETKRQDFKKKTIFDYMTGWEIKAFESAAPRTFDFTTIINRTIPLLNTSANGTTQAIYFPAITGGYLIKSCLWVSKCVVLVGDGATMWNTDLDNVNLKSSMIYADFADKNQWIISSDTKLLSTGIRLAHNAYFTGANSDSELYSFCDGIQIIGLQIHAKNRVFGGVRLFGSVGSYISHDTVVTNCEYSYLTSANWESEHLGSSKYGKCGYFGYDQNNSTKVAGYHNPIGSADVSFVNMLNIFQAGYNIPHALMNEHTRQFGVIIKKSDNVMLDVTCEKADFNLVLEDRVRASGNAYLEVPKIIGLVLGNQCQLNLVGNGGAITTADAVHLGYNAIFIAPTYAFLIEEGGNHMYRGLAWAPTAAAQLPSKYFTQYHQNIVWSDKHDNIVYISPTGSDSSNGANYIAPTNFTQAVKRISNESERYDNSLRVSSNKAVVFYLISEGEYTLNEAYLSLFGRISIKKKSILSRDNTILNMNNFVYLTNCEVDISSVTLKIPNVTYDYVTWARNAPFLSYRGINSLVLNDVATEFQGVNNSILSYANGSDAINTLSIAGGAISGAGLLVQTPESPETGGTTNITVGASCSVDALIKSKSSGGIGIPKEQQGIVVVPWLLRNASTTYNPSSIPAGLSITTTITLTGVVVGDFVQASFTQYNAYVEISAVVSAPNTVTVRFKNTSAAAVDLTGGTLSVKKI